jgi:hypothetical protein
MTTSSPTHGPASRLIGRRCKQCEQSAPKASQFERFRGAAGVVIGPYAMPDQGVAVRDERTHDMLRVTVLGKFGQ